MVWLSRLIINQLITRCTRRRALHVLPAGATTRAPAPVLRSTPQRAHRRALHVLPAGATPALHEHLLGTSTDGLGVTGESRGAKIEALESLGVDA